MAQDETPVETPLKMLRRQVVERIQKQSRDARQETQADVAEGATAEPPAPPAYIAALSEQPEEGGPVETEFVEGEV